MGPRGGDIVFTIYVFSLSARLPCDTPSAFFFSQFTNSYSLADKVSYNEADLILLVTGKQFDPLLFFLTPQASAIPIVQTTTATRVFHLSGSRRVLLQNPIRHKFFFFNFFSPTSYLSLQVPLLFVYFDYRKYFKYCRVAPVVVAVEESILWINHPDRKGLAGVRKGLGH